MSYQSCKGYSLIEALLVLTITMIIAILAISSWRGWREHNQQQLVVDQLLAEIQLARTEAVHRGTMVSLCPLGDDFHCGLDWSKGLLVVDERDQRGIHHIKALPDGISLDWVSSFSRNDRLTFLSSGMTNGQRGHFLLSDASGRAIFKLVVVDSGRVRVES